MKRRISKMDFLHFINSNFRSRARFARELGISYSHLDKLIKGETVLGERTYAKLCGVCSRLGEDVEGILEPLPLNGIYEITVTRKGELVASITSRNIIVKNGYEVVCVPSDDC